MNKTIIATISLLISLIVNVESLQAQSKYRHGYYNDRSDQEIVVKKREKVRQPKVVNHITPKYSKVRHDGRDIYINDGRYYKRNNSKLISITPPHNIRVSSIPSRYKMFRYHNEDFYWVDGVIYKKLRYNQYMVVRPTLGMIVPRIPTNIRKVYYNNILHYQYDDILYLRVNTPYGYRFKVVGIL